MCVRCKCGETEAQLRVETFSQVQLMQWQFVEVPN